MHTKRSCEKQLKRHNRAATHSSLPSQHDQSRAWSNCNCNKLSRRTPLSPSRTGAANNGRATTRIPCARKNRIGSDNLHSTRALKCWTECQRDGTLEAQLRKELRVTMRATSSTFVLLLLIQNWCWASCCFQEWSWIEKIIDPIRMLR